MGGNCQYQRRCAGNRSCAFGAVFCGRNGENLRLVCRRKKPEHALKLFIRFAIAKAAITYGMELMLALFNIVQGTISTIMTAAGFTTAQQTTLPQEMIDTIESCGFFESIPLMGGHAHRRTVYYGYVIPFDNDGVREIF